jgi:hypothetical protein
VACDDRVIDAADPRAAVANSSASAPLMSHLWIVHSLDPGLVEQIRERRDIDVRVAVVIDVTHAEAPLTVSRVEPRATADACAQHVRATIIDCAHVRAKDLEDARVGLHVDETANSWRA